MFRLGALVYGLVLLLVLGGEASALDVRETLWGFDGRVVPGRMNLLSVRLANPGDSVFDGVVTVRETRGTGGGVPYLQPTYLTPHGERWVQFVVFIEGGYEDFVIEWSGGNTQARPQAIAMGPPGRVLLSDPSNPFASSARLKAFPDVLFPTTVAATDGLDGVTLDYAPRWEAVRREAFLDWLRRGGRVLLLHGENGEFPRFTEQLSVLNFEGEKQDIGAGTVLRLPITRREASEQTFVEHGFPALELKTGNPVIVSSPEYTIFQRLAQLTRPQIRWWIINSLTLLYIMVVGPVNYFWGKRLDYRASLGVFAGFVAVFAWLFAVVGRRGYGETQVVHSLSVARALDAGRFDVTQWISAFATQGDIYPLTHHASSNFYAAPHNEGASGKILNGKDGQFLADIPLYSSRQFLHRAVMTGDDTGVTVGQWEEDGKRLKALTLQPGPGFPRETVELIVRFRDNYYRLVHRGGSLVLADGEKGKYFPEFLPDAKVQQATYYNNYGEDLTESKDGELQLLPVLYTHALDGLRYFQRPVERGDQPPGRLQLFIVAKSPAGFALQASGFGHEVGHTLYVQEVLKP